MTIISGTASLLMRDIRATGRSHSASLPVASVWCEIPKVITERIPALAIRSISRAGIFPECASRRHGLDGFVIVDFFFNKIGNTGSFKLSVVSSNMARAARIDANGGGE